MNLLTNQSNKETGVSISGSIGNVEGDIVGGNKIGLDEAKVVDLFKQYLPQLGIVAGLPLLVGFTCQLLSLPTQTTAAISLTALAVCAVIAARQQIDRRVSSSVLLLILAIIACTNYLTYEPSLVKHTGLVGYYDRSNDFLATELTQRLRNAKEEVIFFGSSFEISAADARKELLARLREGVKIHYLIVDPSSAAIEEIAKDFNISASEMRSLVISSLRSILLLKKEWEEAERNTGTPGELQVKVFSARPSMRAYIFDGNRASSESYIVPYINRVNAPDSPGYIFKNKSDGAFSKYYAGITQIWRDAEPLEELLRQHPEILKE
jgi:hypothetical protein